MKTKYFTEFSLAHVGGKIQKNDCYDLRLDMCIYDSTYLRMTGTGKIKSELLLVRRILTASV